MTYQYFSPSTWRLIKSQPTYGAWNMAVDEALLQSIGGGDSPAVLRLYAWSPPCLSLGYAQPSSDVYRERLTHWGWDLVRRLTGGRAILHTDELTYSVIAPNHEPRINGGLLESYLRLSRALLKAVNDLGVPAQATPQTKTMLNNKDQNPICFQVPSKYEITFQGKKLLGSAQARKKDGILQHGSLPLKGDLTRILEVLILDQDPSNQKDSIETKKDLLERATTMEWVLGTPPSWGDTASAFQSAFADVLNITFVEDELTTKERNSAQKLVIEKYTNPNWTMRI